MTEILAEADDLPLEEKLQVFGSVQEEVYKDGADAFAKERRDVMTLAFLNLESVRRSWPR